MTHYPTNELFQANVVSHAPSCFMHTPLTVYERQSLNILKSSFILSCPGNKYRGKKLPTHWWTLLLLGELRICSPVLWNAKIMLLRIHALLVPLDISRSVVLICSHRMSTQLGFSLHLNLTQKRKKCAPRPLWLTSNKWDASCHLTSFVYSS